jgi:hypothetical protein
MRRIRFYDFKLSQTPNAIGLCASDNYRLAQNANAAEQRLIMAKEASDEGWWGTWAEMAFPVSQTTPYLTLPRNIARLEAVDVCQRNIPIQNQFYEYLQFGNGRMPKFRPRCSWPVQGVFSRNTVPTFVDLTNPPQLIAVVPSDPADVEASRRVLIQGTDSTGNTVTSIDLQFQVQGVFLTLAAPFVVSTIPFNTITGIQKDITVGPVQIFQMDPNTGAQILLLTMEPSEQTAAYRRYFFNRLPFDCCSQSPTPQTITVTAICKLDPIPVVSDTDYFTLQGDAAIEALNHECKAIRYERMDDMESKNMAKDHHKQAIGLLNGILNHYIGKNEIAVNFAPFGSARLARLNVGMI